tara:strand:+ start:728 stop:1069 length:342 start_codon:yes stop_codon:yes gene_type:complete
MTTPKRVKITYSVDFNEVLEEVARLIGAKSRPDLSQANELLNQAASSLTKGAALSSIEYMREARDILAGVDYLLEDGMGILLGYVSTKSNETAQEFGAVDPYDMPEETIDEEG